MKATARNARKRVGRDFIPPYSLDFPAAFAAFQRALAEAEILARAAGLIERLVFLTGFTGNFLPRTLAHLAFWAAAIRALPIRLILLRFLGAGVLVVLVDPKSLTNLFSSDSILPFSVAAVRRVFTDKCMMLFMW